MGIYNEKCGRKPVLSDHQRRLAVNLVPQGQNKADIARILKVSPETVCKVLRDPKGHGEE